VPRVVFPAPSTRTIIRRRDRAVEDDNWIRAVLHRAAVGSLAMLDADHLPRLNMNLFAYAEERDAIYMHTARMSSTREAIEGHAQVCFGVMEMGRLLPADRAKNFSVEYASVVVFGRGSVVTDPVEADFGLACLMRKYAPHLESGRDYAAPESHEIQITSVYRISIDEWSGKTRTAPDDAPGAYYFKTG
jgi:nitroimidazol reductase NimA-like FMN-containing flavoprotein (pyridoxamine 5'-phosphate oxidase superfamily)